MIWIFHGPQIITADQTLCYCRLTVISKASWPPPGRICVFHPSHWLLLFSSLIFPDCLKSSLWDMWLHPFCRGTKNTHFSQLTSESLWLHLWIMKILRSGTRHNWSVITLLRQRQCLFAGLLYFLLKLGYQSNGSMKRSDTADRCTVHNSKNSHIPSWNFSLPAHISLEKQFKWP